jgi:hypothetical protein
MWILLCFHLSWRIIVYKNGDYIILKCKNYDYTTLFKIVQNFPANLLTFLFNIFIATLNKTKERGNHVCFYQVNSMEYSHFEETTKRSLIQGIIQLLGNPKVHYYEKCCLLGCGTMQLEHTNIPPKCRLLQEPHGITSQKMEFFIVTIVKTWNLTQFMTMPIRTHNWSLSKSDEPSPRPHLPTPFI